MHIVLPGASHAVPCGRFARTRAALGDWTGRFAYARSYLARADAVPLDPVRLPLDSKTTATVSREGIPGALRDAMPDFWGRFVLSRRPGAAPLDEMGVMLAEATDRTGAIVFSAETNAPPLAEAPSMSLEALVGHVEVLARDYDAFARNDVLTDDQRRLVEAAAGQVAGTSGLGGARPKASVLHEGRFWVAKFPKPNDRWDDPLVECALLRLAAEAGIRVPATRLERVMGRSILLVERFDRRWLDREHGGIGRARYLSGLTLLDSDEEPRDRTEWSYLRLADEVGRLSADPLVDREELFRRMVFNACVSNEDDHPRNHAVIADDREFRLSPAFDLTPSPQAGAVRRLAMVTGVDASGRLTRDANAMAMRRVSARFGLDNDRAIAMINEMARLLRARWELHVKSLGGTARDIALLGSAFVPPAFWYEWESGDGDDR